MKILVDNNNPVDELHLRLNSANTNFKLIVPPLDPFEDTTPIEKPNTAMIVFKDSFEIDQLIRTLERFKDTNYRYFGDWRMM